MRHEHPGKWHVSFNSWKHPLSIILAKIMGSCWRINRWKVKLQSKPFQVGPCTKQCQTAWQSILTVPLDVGARDSPVPSLRELHAYKALIQYKWQHQWDHVGSNIYERSKVNFYSDYGILVHFVHVVHIAVLWLIKVHAQVRS